MESFLERCPLDSLEHHLHPHFERHRVHLGRLGRRTAAEEEHFGRQPLEDSAHLREGVEPGSELCADCPLKATPVHSGGTQGLA
eukprot:4360010-Prymnesium_polylepis.1